MEVYLTLKKLEIEEASRKLSERTKALSDKRIFENHHLCMRIITLHCTCTSCDPASLRPIISTYISIVYLQYTAGSRTI